MKRSGKGCCEWNFHPVRAAQGPGAQKSTRGVCSTAVGIKQLLCRELCPWLSWQKASWRVGVRPFICTTFVVIRLWFLRTPEIKCENQRRALKRGLYFKQKEIKWPPCHPEGALAALNQAAPALHFHTAKQNLYLNCVH